MQDKSDKDDYGPMWQLEQQVKHYDALALSFGGDATRATAKAADARAMAERYRETIARLKAAQ